MLLAVLLAASASSSELAGTDFEPPSARARLARCAAPLLPRSVGPRPTTRPARAPLADARALAAPAAPVRICVFAYAPFVMAAGRSATGAGGSDAALQAAAQDKTVLPAGALQDPYSANFSLTGYDVEFRRVFACACLPAPRLQPRTL